MIRWVPYAFVRIVFFFIAGIWAGIYFPSLVTKSLAEIIFVSFVLLYCIVAGIVHARGPRKEVTNLRLGIGVLGLITIFCAGYVILLSNVETDQPEHITHLKSSVDYYEVVITDPAKEKKNAWKTEGKITAAHYNNSWHPSRGNVLLYFPKKGFDKPFFYGDVLIVKGKPVSVPSPANPEEFDYKRFLTFKNIYHQQFINAKQVKHIDHAPPSVVMELSYKLRSWAEVQLNKYVIGFREQGIISALVLGITDGLDDDLLSAYSATGAMHVLAVSGLHVGIIYGLLLLLLTPLNKRLYGKLIIAFISVFVLWSYAFVTGLSPSVLRAVTMFTFVALARPAGLRTNIYNTLAASAFVLLLCNPYLIMSVGFQLSYLAVLGIVYLQPRLYRMIESDKRIIRALWKITSVSIAAQIATFALGLLYFHQFPNYFIFSNLFVIPISTVVLVSGLTLLALSFFAPVATLIGYIITLLIKLMNFLVFFVESRPFSMIENVYINTAQCWLLFGIVISFILLFKYKRFNYVWAATTFAILFSTIQWNHYLNYSYNKKIAVYHVNGHSAIDLMGDGTAYFLADSSLKSDQEMIRFHIKPHRLICNVQNVIHEEQMSFVKREKGCRLICWHGQSILQIDKSDFKIPPSIQINYLIVSNNAIKDLSAISNLNYSRLIIDSSNSIYYANKLLKQASDRHVGVYSILHQGALIAKL